MKNELDLKTELNKLGVTALREFRVMAVEEKADTEILMLELLQDYLNSQVGLRILDAVIANKLGQTGEFFEDFHTEEENFFDGLAGDNVVGISTFRTDSELT